jgi:hypothetical protein
MSEPTSRYYSLETATLVMPDGRQAAYLRRRFLPRGRDLTLLAETAVQQSERLDLMAHRTLGDPLQFWRICDANDAMDPLELTAQPGRLLRIPVPQP